MNRNVLICQTWVVYPLLEVEKGIKVELINLLSKGTHTSQEIQCIVR